MAANNLLFTLLSGIVLLVIVAAILRVRSWRHDTSTLGPSGSTWATASDALRSPTTWTIGFFLLVLLAVAGTLAVVGGLPISEAAQATATTALLAGAGLVFAGFVFLGVYASVRSRGYGSAPAVGLGSLTLGFLALLVVVLNLFLG